MDDITVFSGNNARLHRTVAEIRTLLGQALRLELQEERTRFAPVSQGVPHLGFRVFPGMMRLDSSKWSRRRRVRALQAARLQGRIRDEALEQSVRSMIGHVRHADTLQARRSLFPESVRLVDRLAFFADDGDVPCSPAWRCVISGRRD